MLHLVMLLPVCEVGLRCAVTLCEVGEIDLTHMPRGVSSRQNRRDLRDSRGHVARLLLLLSVCFHASPDAQLVSDVCISCI